MEEKTNKLRVAVWKQQLQQDYSIRIEFKKKKKKKSIKKAHKDKVWDPDLVHKIIGKQAWQL